MTDFARCTGTTAEVCRYCRRREQGNWPDQWVLYMQHQPEENNWCSLYVEPPPVSVSNTTGSEQ